MKTTRDLSYSRSSMLEKQGRERLGLPPLQLCSDQSNSCMAAVGPGGMLVVCKHRSKRSNCLIALAAPQNRPDMEIEYLKDPSCYKTVKQINKAWYFRLCSHCITGAARVKVAPHASCGRKGLRE